MSVVRDTILGDISFLYFCIADLDDDKVDSKERSLIHKLLPSWSRKPLAANHLNTLIHNSYVFFCEFKENDYPSAVFLGSLNRLSLLFSKSNMRALLEDLTEIASLDHEFSEREQDFIEILISNWELNSSVEEEEAHKFIRLDNFNHFFRLNRELKLSELLRETFQVDSLAPLIKSMEQEISSFSLDENLESGHLVDLSLIPKLNALLAEVCETLEVHEPFEFFVTNQPIQGAWMWAGTSSYGKNFITLTSEMAMSLSDEELKFVIGHEIGHWLFNNNDIHGVLRIAYDAEDQIPSLSLQNLLSTWRKLAEFSADRVGLVACGSLDHAIRTLYRVSTGLDPSLMEFDSEKYLDGLKSKTGLPKVKELEVFRQSGHPPLPIRMLAIERFACSDLFQKWQNQGLFIEDDCKLRDEMSNLISLIDFTSEDNLHNRRLLAIGLGGFLLAGIDDEILTIEVERIREILLRFVLNPEPIISYIISLIEDEADTVTMLKDVLFDIVSANDDQKYELMNIYIEIALSDGKLMKEETDILLNIGSFLGIDNDSLLRVLTNFLGRGFYFEKRVPEEVSTILDRPVPFFLGSTEERIEKAQDEDSNFEELNQLAEDADPRVRLSVLYNQSTSEEIRLKLLDSPSLHKVLNEMSECEQNTES